MEINIDKLGKDPEHNILYITGLPGSGKTTLANKISVGRDIVIHLDAYAEGNEEQQNKQFNNFIMYNHVVGDFIVTSPYDFMFPDLMSSVKKDERIEDFACLIEVFGKEQYSHHKFVIVEGFQIFSGWLHNDVSFYLDKPLIILNPPVQTAIVRMAKRDKLFEDEVSGRLCEYQRLNQEFMEFQEKIKGR